MQTRQGALYFGAGINMDEWNKNIRKMREDILGLTSQTEKETTKMDSSFKKLSIGLGAYFSVSALKGFTSQLIAVRGEFQKTEIAFGTMLKSKEKAKSLMQDMVHLAAVTPFGLQDVTEGAKRLLAFQVPAEQVIDTLTRIGNVSAGLGVPMGQLIHVYGQVKAQGRMMTNDLYQFMNAGIPIIAELGKVLGKADAEIKQMVSDGKIGFPEVQKVIQNMTNEGGLFFNLMEEQSKSLSGKVANLEDAIHSMFNEIGEGTEGILNSGIDGLSYLVENYERVAKTLVELIAVYGTYRTAVILTAAIQKNGVTGAVIQGFQRLAVALRLATVEQNKFNFTAFKNPYALVLAGVVALGIGIYEYRQELGELIGVLEKTTAATKVQDAVNKEYNENFGKGVAEKKTQIQQLINIIKNEYATLDQRKQAYERLISIDASFRGTLDAQYKATYRLGNAFDHVISRMRAFAKAQAEVAVEAKKMQEQAEAEWELGVKKLNYENADKAYKESLKDNSVGNFLKHTGAAYRVDKAKQELNEQEALVNSLKSQNKLILNKKNNELESLKKGIAIQEAQIKGGKIAGKKLNEQELQNLKEQKKANEELLAVKMGMSSTEPSSATPPATDPNKDDKKKDKKGSAKKLAEIYSKGSIADLEQRISLWNEALSKASGDTVRELAKNKYGETVKTGKTVSKEDALKTLETLEKAKAQREKEIRNQSFDEELSETERQWKVRYMLAKEYGEEVAKAQFPNLKGDSYFAEIEAKYKALHDKIEQSKTEGSGVAISDEEIAQWQKLKNILDNLKGVKDPFTNFKDSLDDSLAGIETNVGRIEFLKEKLENLSKEERDAGAEAEINNRLADEERAYQTFYQNFLNEHKTWEEKKTQMATHYAQLRAKANSDAELAKINKAEKDDNSKLEMDFIKSTDDWKMAFGEVEYYTQSTINRILANLQKYYNEKKESLNPTEERELAQAISRLQQQANKNPFTKIIKGFGDYKKARNDVKKAEEEYQRVLDANNGNEKAEASINAYKKLTEEEQKASEAKKNLAEGMRLGQEIFNATLSSVTDVADAFGGMSDATKDALEDIANIGNAALDLGQSIASGNVAGMIKAGVQLIGSIFKALSGDKKKERSIKKQAEVVKKLESAYNDLAFATERALGEKKYDGQRAQIQNLEQQKKALAEMARTEASKKKKDQGKINEYNEKIKEINRTIQQAKESIAKDILQTDAVDAAKAFGDALVDAYGKGENAIDAIDKASQDMVKNMLKNQLNKRLEAPMQRILDNLLKDAGFDKDGNGSFKGLTKEQIEKFKTETRNATQGMQSFLDGYSEIFGELDTKKQGLTGDIKGITEKTAGALESQINAMRIVVVEVMETHKKNREIFQQSLKILFQIEANTRPLYQIQKDIAELNSKVKTQLAGI